MTKPEPRMFYIHVHLPNKPTKCFWMHTVPGADNLSLKLNINAYCAEAYDEFELTRRIFQASMIWPGCTIIAIECDSSKLIPTNMRRLLNIA